MLPISLRETRLAGQQGRPISLERESFRTFRSIILNIVKLFTRKSCFKGNFYICDASLSNETQ